MLAPTASESEWKGALESWQTSRLPTLMVSIEEQHPNAEYRSSVTVFGLSFVVLIEQVGARRP